MTTTYGVQVFQSGRDDDVDRLRQAVAAELEALGLHRDVAVAVAEASPPEGSPAVGLFLGGPDAVTDGSLREPVEACLASGVVVIPVVENLHEFHAQVPAYLAHANGVEWATLEQLPGLVRLLLEELGIEETQRRVFISHKRDDGLGAAEQLHDTLSHHGFRPFIDRFAVRVGQGVQAEIADALEDHAFLLLLETPLAHTSEWVFDEVDYALSHAMGVLILRWPGEPPPVPGSQGLPRIDLAADEIVPDAHGYDTLTEAGLSRIVSEVEAAHAWGLARRRRLIIRSIEEAAVSAGAQSCTPLPSWRLHVQQADRSTIVGSTPRLPTARDLQALDEAAKAEADDPSRLLVHSARALRPDLREHLHWVAGDREITVMPENAIGGWW